MTEFLHILDRAVLHFFSATSLVLLAFMGLRAFNRRRPSEWFPVHWKASLSLAALTVFGFATLREAWDVAAGQSLIKASVDYFSWFAGCAVAAYGLYRFGKDIHRQ